MPQIAIVCRGIQLHLINAHAKQLHPFDTCTACSSSLRRDSLFDQQLHDAMKHAQLVSQVRLRRHGRHMHAHTDMCMH